MPIYIYAHLLEINIIINCNDIEVTSFSVAICMKQTKILCRQLNCLAKLADVDALVILRAKG